MSRMAALIIVGVAAAGANAAPTPSACHAGAYRFDDVQLMVIGAPVETTLRYRFLDGRAGQLFRQADGSFAGGAGWSAPPPPTRIAVAGACGLPTLAVLQDGPRQRAVRVPVVITETRFTSGGLRLRGRLVAPTGSALVPLAVYVHGSERSSAVDAQLDQHMAPANGVAAFVYDKRGTGGSQGKYTQDFDVLAADAVAAMTEAKRLLGARTGRAGFIGHSQGGWVAPLAATRGGAAFVVVGYGLAISPRAEDAAQVRYDLERAGYGPEVLAKAREVSDATAEVMASRFKRGFDALAAVKRKYGDEPWFARVKGDYTGDLLRYPAFVLKLAGPRREQGTPWDYDPMPVLRGFDRPMLWVLAGADSDAPSTSTQAILADLQQDRPALDVAIYPNTTHGMIRFHEDKAGNRTKLGYAASYQTLVLDWVKRGTLTPASDVDLRPGRAER